MKFANGSRRCAMCWCTWSLRVGILLIAEMNIPFKCCCLDINAKTHMTKILKTFVAGFLVALSFGCSTVSRAEPEKMTVLSYNIHHGAGTDGKLDLERIGRIIRDQQPDLVALQEVDVKTS